ncbi:MAG TPA: UDP-glucose 4-epimerase GalE [Rudaea sp.]|jgi:UDP-glucose 4-epimerase
MKRNKPVLVTGGAGYIGSHVALQLAAAGETVVVIDDLSTGFADAVLDAELVVANVGDVTMVEKLLRQREIDTVMHFAARTIVPESVEDPLRYYGNNSCATRNLLACCMRSGVRHFVFSSTAAVYGEPDAGRVDEDSPTTPINPYGSSKLVSEWMLRDLARCGGMRHVVLRYFNVAGSDIRGRIGQSTLNATLLTKVACEVAVGRRPHLRIFGTDYPTPDGTGVRDYVHVDDLARAHLAALEYLRQGGYPVTLNCGYGHGYSVREVAAAVGRANGAAIAIVEYPRRAGDPPSLIADVRRIRTVLGWEPCCDDIDLIAATSLAWERNLQRRIEVERQRAYG